jgi:hypothetical protein
MELSATREFGRSKFEWPIEDKTVKWIRFEVWDVARNGAYTQAR